ncbi:MAG TPA: hypothetical protein DCX06_09935 [Opitutae bacterium]|nr:hypothetical protein [Opitutae bacterium]
MSLRNYFQPTLDLPGVTGIFCLNAEGQLIENFLPSAYTDAIFKELGTRCLTLLNAVDMSYTQTNEYLVCFEGDSLFLHKAEGCIIGVLCSGNPMLAGIRVSINLLLKTAQDAIAQAPLKEIAIKTVPNQPQAKPLMESNDDDIIIAPKKVKDSDLQEAEEPKRKGLFGFKKDKKSKPSNDIWG